jgi:hypothetical protein
MHSVRFGPLTPKQRIPDKDPPIVEHAEELRQLGLEQTHARQRFGRSAVCDWFVQLDRDKEKPHQTAGGSAIEGGRRGNHGRDIES